MAFPEKNWKKILTVVEVSRALKMRRDGGHWVDFRPSDWKSKYKTRSNNQYTILYYIFHS